MLIGRRAPRLAGLAVAAAAFLLLAGCESAPIGVGLKRPVVEDAKPAGRQSPVVLLPVLDQRPGTTLESSGTEAVGSFVVTRDSLTGWVEDAVRGRLGDRCARLADAVPDSATQLAVVIKRCYVQSIRGHVSVQIVLAAEWTDPDGTVRRELIRGQRVGSVWWSVQGELEAVLRLALEDAVEKL